jgi:hypothetical protein
VLSLYYLFGNGYLEMITEPSAVAPDSRVYFASKAKDLDVNTQVTLVSGATALGSVISGRSLPLAVLRSVE